MDNDSNKDNTVSPYQLKLDIKDKEYLDDEESPTEIHPEKPDKELDDTRAV